jgi:hypothetical protein
VTTWEGYLAPKVLAENLPDVVEFDPIPAMTERLWEEVDGEQPEQRGEQPDQRAAAVSNRARAARNHPVARGGQKGASYFSWMGVEVFMADYLGVDRPR